MSSTEGRDGTLGEVIDERVKIYGDPTETFGRIAEVWSGIIGHHINPVEVPLMLIGMKLVRTQVTPDYSDNSDDVEGYLDIFRQLVGDDMVQARTVTDYIEQKKQREREEYPLQRVPASSCPKCLHEGQGLHWPTCADYPLPPLPEPELRPVQDGGMCVSLNGHIATTRHTPAECPTVTGRL